MARVGGGAQDRLQMASLKVGGMQKGGVLLQRLGSEPAPRSNRGGWEDAEEELGEEEVWGEAEAEDEGKVGGSENARPAKAAGGIRRSLLSMEMQEFSRKSRGMAAGRRGSGGIGFASVEAVAANGHGGGGGGEVVMRKISISGWRESAAEQEEAEAAGGVPQSAPVSVPVWMRRSRSCDMMMMETSGRKNRAAAAAAALEEEEEEEAAAAAAEEGWVPPHEMVARSQGMTSSVCEGAGRTLKGMDLRRVRNSVWSRTGFVD